MRSVRISGGIKDEPGIPWGDDAHVSYLCSLQYLFVAGYEEIGARCGSGCDEP